MDLGEAQCDSLPAIVYKGGDYSTNDHVNGRLWNYDSPAQGDFIRGIILSVIVEKSTGLAGICSQFERVPCLFHQFGETHGRCEGHRGVIFPMEGAG